VSLAGGCSGRNSAQEAWLLPRKTTTCFRQPPAAFGGALGKVLATNKKTAWNFFQTVDLAW
jgi:hypothetical protein